MSSDGRVDMTDVIHQALQQGHAVGSYVFDDYWLDIGQPADYEKANQDFLMTKSLSGPSPSPIRWLQATAQQRPRQACSE